MQRDTNNSDTSSEIQTSLISILAEMEGVVEACALLPEDARGIQDAEEKNQQRQIVKLINLGIHTVLKRQYIFLILKNERFRPPPCPTIYLIEETPCGKDEPSDHYIRTEDAEYKIVGEEILDPKTEYPERHIYFTKSLVLFPDRRRQSKNVPASFLIPPISFPELEIAKENLSISEIVSVSPSAPADEYLREKYHLSPAQNLATILIGCNSSQPPIPK